MQKQKKETEKMNLLDDPEETENGMYLSNLPMFKGCRNIKWTAFEIN